MKESRRSRIFDPLSLSLSRSRRRSRSKGIAVTSHNSPHMEIKVAGPESNPPQSAQLRTAFSPRIEHSTEQTLRGESPDCLTSTHNSNELSLKIQQFYQSFQPEEKHQSAEQCSSRVEDEVPDFGGRKNMADSEVRLPLLQFANQRTVLADKFDPIVRGNRPSLQTFQGGKKNSQSSFAGDFQIADKRSQAVGSSRAGFESEEARMTQSLQLNQLQLEKQSLQRQKENLEMEKRRFMQFITRKEGERARVPDRRLQHDVTQNGTLGVRTDDGREGRLNLAKDSIRQLLLKGREDRGPAERSGRVSAFAQELELDFERFAERVRRHLRD